MSLRPRRRGGAPLSRETSERSKPFRRSSESQSCRHVFVQTSVSVGSSQQRARAIGPTTVEPPPPPPPPVANCAAHISEELIRRRSHKPMAVANNHIKQCRRRPRQCRATALIKLVTILQLLASLGALIPIDECMAQTGPRFNGDLPTPARHQSSGSSPGHRPQHRRLHSIRKRSELEELAPETTGRSGDAAADGLDAAASSESAANQQHRRHQQAVAAPIRAETTRLHIVRLFALDAVQNGTQDVTIDCMFKYDKKLDQRLAIKWFFNDEVEPIYQWIPELNKRVYSDKYERFIDKQYQVNEDVNFMLQAYKSLAALPGEHERERDWERALSTTSLSSNHQPAASGEQLNADSSNSIFTAAAANSKRQQATDSPTTTNNNDDHHDHHDDLTAAALEDEPQQLVAGRKLLAHRLNRLAKLGSDQSRQLLGSLRTALAMSDEGVSKFRALRLIRPTVEMDGRYTCSISSLDGDDLKSARLIVYEPPKNFTFNVSKSANQMYNLTCHAGPTFPRPSLALYRYRAGQIEHQQHQQQPPAQDLRSDQRPRLAASTLKQEPLPGTQVQLKISLKQRTPTRTGVISAPGATTSLADDDHDHGNLIARKRMSTAKLGGDMITMENSLAAGLARINLDLEDETVVSSPLDATNSNMFPGGERPAVGAANPYEVSAWALIDEASLSGSLVTQFECVLTIEGANYEQRQSLALQKGWHVNSSAFTAKSTLVGLMSVLASLSCLAVALVSAILIFKLLRRHANKSTKQQQRRTTGKRRQPEADERGRSNAGCEASSAASSSSATPSGDSTAGGAAADDENRSFNSSRGFGLGSGRSSARNHSARHSDSDGRGGRQLTTKDSAQCWSTQQQQQQQQPTPNVRGSVQPSGDAYQQQRQQQQKLNYPMPGEVVSANDHSDGIYRVPENRSSFGTRYVPHEANHNHHQQQQQIWTTPCAGASLSSSNTIGLAGPFNERDFKPPDDGVYKNHLLVAGHYQQHSGQQMHSNNSMRAGGGMSNQLKAAANAMGSDATGGGQTQPPPHYRPQPATISVNGKQLYC